MAALLAPRRARWTLPTYTATASVQTRGKFVSRQSARAASCQAPSGRTPSGAARIKQPFDWLWSRSGAPSLIARRASKPAGVLTPRKSSRVFRPMKGQPELAHSR